MGHYHNLQDDKEDEYIDMGHIHNLHDDKEDEYYYKDEQPHLNLVMIAMISVVTYYCLR